MTTQNKEQTMFCLSTTTPNLETLEMATEDDHY